MSIVKDINSLVKTKKISPKIPDLNPQSDRASTRNSGDISEAEGIGGAGLVSPVTFTALTYDDAKDVTITDTSAVEHIIKTVKTAQIEDAEGTIIEIDNVIFTVPA